MQILDAGTKIPAAAAKQAGYGGTFFSEKPCVLCSTPFSPTGSAGKYCPPCRSERVRDRRPKFGPISPDVPHGRKTTYGMYGCRCRPCTEANRLDHKKFADANPGYVPPATLENRRRLDEIKVGRGCTDCGYNSHPEALDFDHVRGVKKFAISVAYNYAWDRVLAEIDKCEVVCANCHRVRTSSRRQGQ